jgi:catechol 1,2-dioxygenase
VSYENPTTPIPVGQVPDDADPRTKRTAQVVGALLERMWATMTDLDVSYAEYDAAKDWLIAVGEAGEWPLFLDVFFEHVVEALAAAKSAASPSSIQGPFYVPGSPLLPWNGTVPMRRDEPGDRLVVRGRVRSADGSPIAGAVIDHWQADADGYYSHFHPSSPEGNLRARFETNEEGAFEIHTVRPGPYMIPHEGPTGHLLEAAGWHPWRPAHLHYFVDAPGHDRLTTQLFFAGDPWLGTDVAGATKPDLVFDPTPRDDGAFEIDHDFCLQPGVAKRQAVSALAGAP